jgi:DNA-binding CsgD family transcriptional regulator
MAIKLTNKEQAVYDTSMFGYSIEQLGNIFEVSESQIKRHLGNIYKKRAVDNRIELMAKHIMMLDNKIRELDQQVDNLEEIIIEIREGYD